MLRVYDKAQWHIDAGEVPETVLTRFKDTLCFLDEKGLLSEEGKEIIEMGVDSSVSIHERMLNEQGNGFMEQCYDAILAADAFKIGEAMEKQYSFYLDAFKDGA